MDLSLWGSPFSPLYHQLFWNWTQGDVLETFVPSAYLSLHVVGNFIYSHGFCRLMTAKYPQVGLCSFQICNHLPNVCPHMDLPQVSQIQQASSQIPLFPKLLLPPSTKWCESETWYHLFFNFFLHLWHCYQALRILPSKLFILVFHPNLHFDHLLPG